MIDWNVLICAWATGIVFQWACLLRLNRLPAFTLFLLYDFLRSACIFLIVLKPKHANLYAYTFAWTEPLDFILLGGAAIEAGYAMAPRGSSLFPVVLGACLVITRSLPDAVRIPIGGMLLARTMVTASVVTALLITAVWCQRLTLHASTLWVYCIVDLTAYLALLMGSKPWVPSQFILIAQAACLLAWLLSTKQPQPAI